MDVAYTTKYVGVQDGKNVHSKTKYFENYMWETAEWIYIKQQSSLLGCLPLKGYMC